MSRIRIKNFGPIKSGLKQNDGWIDIRKVTLFIGNQGTGKSTVAKLISSMTWIEKALIRDEDISKNNKLDKKWFIDICSFQNLENYFSDKTEIEYEGKAFKIKLIKKSVTVEKNTGEKYAFPKVMYVPSERNLASSVKNIRDLEGLPKTLYTFSDEYDAALNDIKKEVSLPISDAKLTYDKISENTFIKEVDYSLNLNEASSGFQSFVPLYLVSKYLGEGKFNKNKKRFSNLSINQQKKLRLEIIDIILNNKLSDEIRKTSLEFLSSQYSYSSFINIVEEPEQNLFPTSQREILNSLLEINNLKEENKLILTTHSPYILNFLNLSIYSSFLYEKTKSKILRKRIDEIVNNKSQVNINDVIVYELGNNEISILSTEFGINSDKNYLNDVIKLGNSLFDELIAIEEEL